MAKFGWDSSKGLGASGDGRLTHVKASQKLDMLGIGADHQKSPNGIAWKQNQDFENLLKRLNGGSADEQTSELQQLFKKEDLETKDDVSAESEVEGKKRKRSNDGDKAERKRRRKEEKAKARATATADAPPASPKPEIPAVLAPRPGPPRHRA